MKPPRNRVGEVMRRNNMYALKKGLEGWWASPVASMEQYLRKYGATKQSFQRILEAVYRYVAWCKEHGYKWDDPASVEEFMQELVETRSHATVRFYYSILKRLFQLWGLDFPYQRPPRKEYYPRREYLNEDEMRRLLQAADELAEEAFTIYGSQSRHTIIAFALRAMVYLAMDLGLRRQEIQSMNIGDVDTNRMQVYVRTAKHGVPKWQSISEATARAIETYLKLARPKSKNQPLFTPQRRLSLWSLTYMFNMLAKRAGIYRPGLGWHSIRRGLATLLYKKGKLRERELQEVLRWKTPTMPHIYIQETGDHLEDTIRRIRITENPENQNKNE